jgi:2-polyprenyl-3-methyl-5-hydroxy-6-metoxy-1,4-benzoquinol methylase
VADIKAHLGTSPLAGIGPIFVEKGLVNSLEEFHQIVNLAYHAEESKEYDVAHRHMRRTIPRQLEALINACARAGLLHQPRLRALDVGCGTGLSAEMLLNSPVGPRVTTIDLLDTSAEMLAKCAQRPAIKERGGRLVHGSLDCIPQGPPYDVILVCSVLHHLEDLGRFCAFSSDHQAPGGVLIHLQDPNGDYLDDPDLRLRMRQLQRSWWTRIGWIRKRMSPLRHLHHHGPGLTSRVNQRLTQGRSIRAPLDELELWRIVDLRVHDGHGISIQALASMLPEYRIVARRTWSFYGELASELPWWLRFRDWKLECAGNLNGMHLGGAWTKCK